MPHGEPTGSYSASPTSEPISKSAMRRALQANQDEQALRALRASEAAGESDAQHRQDIAAEFAEAQGLARQFDQKDLDNAVIMQGVAGSDIDDDDVTLTNTNDASTSDSSSVTKSRVLTDKEVSAFRLKQRAAGVHTNEPIVHDPDPGLQFQQFMDVPGRQEQTGRQTLIPRNNEDTYDPEMLNQAFARRNKLEPPKPKPEKEDE